MIKLETVSKAEFQDFLFCERVKNKYVTVVEKNDDNLTVIVGDFQPTVHSPSTKRKTKGEKRQIMSGTPIEML